MSRPMFLYTQCFGCMKVWDVRQEWCANCKTNQWLSDEWLEAENE